MSLEHESLGLKPARGSLFSLKVTFLCVALSLESQGERVLCVILAGAIYMYVY